MVEAESGLAVRRQGIPIGARGLQQNCGSHHIGSHEIQRPIDGPVIMALCGQMHDRVGLVGRKNPMHLGRVADIGLLEDIATRSCDLRHILQIGGIGQDIEIDHIVTFGDGASHDGRSNKPGSAGDDEFHAASVRLDVGDLHNRRLQPGS